MDRQGSPQTYSTAPERRSCLKSSSSSVGGGHAIYGNTSEPTSFSPLVTSSASLARRRRQKIIRSVLCLFAVLIGLVAALTLLLSPLRTRNTSFGVCLSESCLQYVRGLEASINPELDPCRDFHAYVCSRWRPVAGGRSFLEDAILDFEDKYILQALATKAPKRGQTNFHKGALFYQSCVTKKDHGIRSLKEFLDMTGLNWPAVNMDSDPFQVIFNLSFEWRCPVFFYAYVSSGRANAHRLQVLDLFMGFDFSAFLAEHRSRVDRVGHVCQLYDALADVPDVAEDKSGNKSRCYGIAQLYSYLMDRLDVQEPLGSASYSNIHDFALNATPALSGDEWERGIARHLQREKSFYSGTPVDVKNPEYIKALTAMLSDTHKEDLLLFIGLAAIQAVGRFISRRIAALVYPDEWYGARQRHYTACYHMTDAVMWGALGGSITSYDFEDYRQKKLKEVARVVAASSTDLLRQSAWLGPESTRALTRKINNAPLLFGEQGIEPAAGNVTIEDMTDFLPHNVKRLPRVYWAWVYGLSKSRDTWTNPWRQANVTYAPQKLVVPDVYMLSKVSPEGAYESVNYATVGSLIARQISSTHDLKGRAIDTDGTERPLLSPDEQRKQDKLIDCLVKTFERQYNGTEVISEEDKSALYVAWASLSPLLNALQFSPGYPDRSAGFLQYTAIQLFFISLCFQVCSQERESDVFNEAMWCNFPLRLFKPFQESFQCAGNSAMHSAVECDGELLSTKSL